MIGTKDLIEYLKILRPPEWRQGVHNKTSIDEEIEYRLEIVVRLRAYDRICRDLRQLIATLSTGVDK